MGTRPLNKGKQSSYHAMYSKTIYTVDVKLKRPSYKVVYARYVMSSCTYTTPFPPPPLDPRRPLHMLYICIATFNCPKGILGLGGESI